MTAQFSSVALSPILRAVVSELGYEQMTPIQAQTIPLLLAGKDVIGQSKTGSGKTAAFALPILENLDANVRSVQALVLCPTRELCAQVTREFRKLGRKFSGLVVLPVSGGEPLRHQAQALARGLHVIVGTPGRVIDHLARGSLDLSHVKSVVLDEADRMLDMGFQADMEKILAAVPEERQTVFFSATFPGSIAAMSRAHQKKAVRVTIDEPAEAPVEIRQVAVNVDPTQKLQALRWVLGKFPHESALVFCNLKATVAELSQKLTEAGVSAQCIHGDLEQFQRDQVLAMFRNQSVRILVASDVAARGLDVVDLDLVVNYDLPSEAEVYLHRIGRTGRAGKSGLAVSLTTPRDSVRLGRILKLTGVPLEELAAELGGSRKPAPSLTREARMATIHIAGGRKDKVRPGDLLGALTGEAGGLAAEDVGKIEIHDRFSYVAVKRSLSREAVQSLNAGRIKGRRFRAVLV